MLVQAASNIRDRQTLEAAVRETDYPQIGEMAARSARDISFKAASNLERAGASDGEAGRPRLGKGKATATAGCTTAVKTVAKPGSSQIANGHGEASANSNSGGGESQAQRGGEVPRDQRRSPANRGLQRERVALRSQPGGREFARNPIILRSPKEKRSVKLKKNSRRERKPSLTRPRAARQRQMLRGAATLPEEEADA